MTNLNTTDLNTATATEVPAAEVAPTAIEKLLAGSKVLAKLVDKVNQIDAATADQRLEVQMIKEEVTAALSGQGDFAAASKAFQVANNKLDKLLEARESALSSAKLGQKALRDHLDAVADQLRALED